MAFLKAICEAAGFVVHSYTSPHLVRFAERISVAGRLLDDHELVSLLEECETVNGGEPITFFEVTTAAAFLAFARTQADVTLIETGLGGRFDATNVFDRPSLTAITPVSMDHMSFLGETIDAIAFEKAGILKKDTPAIIAPQQSAASRVIQDRADQVGAPLWCFGTDWQADTTADGILLRDGAETVSLPPPSLLGPHQTINAGLAAICARRLPSLSVGTDALAQGLRTAIWPGRLQRLDNGPLAAHLNPGWELWLDGAHNAAAADMLAQVASTWEEKPLHLIFGARPGQFSRPSRPPCLPPSRNYDPRGRNRDGCGRHRSCRPFGRNGGKRISICLRCPDSHRADQCRTRPHPDLRLSLSGRHRTGPKRNPAVRRGFLLTSLNFFRSIR